MEPLQLGVRHIALEQPVSGEKAADAFDRGSGLARDLLHLFQVQLVFLDLLPIQENVRIFQSPYAAVLPILKQAVAAKDIASRLQGRLLQPVPDRREPDVRPVQQSCVRGGRFAPTAVFIFATG
ncbi:MAG: hypothetical protein ACREX9_15620 [Gammaproteobacteria bacterium]